MIASETLIQVMLDNRELVASKKVFPRETEIGTFPRYVLVGVRRSGKSYLLYQSKLVQTRTDNRQILLKMH